MKKSIAVICALFLGVMINAQGIVGTWKQVDDETGKAKSYIEIYKKSDGLYYAKIVKILNKDRQNAKCEKCPEPYKDKPILGLDIITKGLKKESDKKYSDGKILKADSGEIFDVYFELKGKNKLKVRGFLKIAMLGRTQYWYRVSE